MRERERERECSCVNATRAGTCAVAPAVLIDTSATPFEPASFDTPTPSPFVCVLDGLGGVIACSCRSSAGMEDWADAGTEDWAGAGTEDWADTGTEAWADAGTEDWADTGTEDWADAGTEDWADAETEDWADAGTEVWVDAGTEAWAGAGTEAWVDAGTEAWADAGTEDWANTGTEDWADAGTEEPGVEDETELDGGCLETQGSGAVRAAIASCLNAWATMSGVCARNCALWTVRATCTLLEVPSWWWAGWGGVGAWSPADLVTRALLLWARFVRLLSMAAGLPSSSSCSSCFADKACSDCMRLIGLLRGCACGGRPEKILAYSWIGADLCRGGCVVSKVWPCVCARVCVCVCVCVCMRVCVCVLVGMCV